MKNHRYNSGFSSSHLKIFDPFTAYLTILKEEHIQIYKTGFVCASFRDKQLSFYSKEPLWRILQLSWFSNVAKTTSIQWRK